jgi:hypothetical protein
MDPTNYKIGTIYTGDWLDDMKHGEFVAASARVSAADRDTRRLRHAAVAERQQVRGSRGCTRAHKAA